MVFPVNVPREGGDVYREGEGAIQDEAMKLC